MLRDVTFELLTKKHREIKKEALWYTETQNLPPENNLYHQFWDKNTNKNAKLRAIAELRECSDPIMPPQASQGLDKSTIICFKSGVLR